MQAVYLLLFGLFAGLAGVLEYSDAGWLGLLSAAPAAHAPARGGGGGVSAQGPAAASCLKPEYVRFRNNYVLIFSLMMAGDWLQGPYVYHLYEHYGFSVRDIGRLFIMGFGASAVLGTLAGAMADRKGRKRAALMYVAAYSASCVTKHSAHYWVLMLGRLLGGVATSLLFSAFESWAVAAHNAAGFEEALLSDLFTKAVFWGSGLMAIASGLLGNVLVEGLALGPVAPFDAAIVVLLVGGAAIHLTWRENYGSRGGPPSSALLAGQFGQALHTIHADARVALLGASQALFEASMYTFVFLWTPALSPAGERLPHGFIFAIFMTASMAGTSLAGRLARANFQLEVVMQAVFWASAASLFVPVVFHLQRHPQVLPASSQLQAAAPSAAAVSAQEHLFHISRAQSSRASSSIGLQQLDAAAMSGRLLLSGALGADSVSASLQTDAGGDPATASLDTPAAAAVVPAAAAATSSTSDALPLAGVVQLFAFCVFEVLIGMFWPSMMTLRAKYVPEEQRSTIINVFRVPLNLFVCLILWKVSDFPLGIIFAVCSLFLAAAAGCQWHLRRLTRTGYMPADSGGKGGAGGPHIVRVKADKNSADGYVHGNGGSADALAYKVVSLPTSPTSMV